MTTIQELYKKVVLERVIRDLIAAGTEVTVQNVKDGLAAFLATNDIAAAQFESDDFEVEAHTSSSAQLYNDTNETIKDDMSVLYSIMFVLGQRSMDTLDRWRNELDRLGTQLDDLDDRITNLLLAAEDTEGFFNFVSDCFIDTSKIDLDESSIVIDLGREQVTLGAAEVDGFTRLNLNNLSNDDIQFSVLTRKNLNSTIRADGSERLNTFNDTSRFWQDRVLMTQPDPVVTELLVHIGEFPIQISRITMQLHAANTNAAIQVTPLYSTDGFTFKQLPTDSFSQSVLRKATFVFTTVSATHVKFIMTKDGFDFVKDEVYNYEFGADEISFYTETFEDDTSGTFFSTALSVLDEDGNPTEFNKAALDVCDLIPDDTSIDYFLAATEELTTSVSELNYVQIDPLVRTSPVFPQVINFTDLEEFEVGNTTVSGDFVKISYDPTLTSGLFINPAAAFTTVSLSGTTVVESNITASGLRYALPTRCDRLLDHQIATAVDIKEGQLLIFRNLGVQGNKDEVRNIQSGWGFTDPFYYTVIEVLNTTGVDINFGESQVIIDDVALTGEQHITAGLHSVRVHRTNWLDVNPDDLEDSTLDSLKLLDPLYPYNHKMLIEGLIYPSDWSDEKVYVGVDVFAEFLLKKVSAFDMLSSVADNDYEKFATDFDVGEGSRLSSRILLVKVDSQNPDFINERFAVRFSVNTGSLTFKHVYLRADFNTQNESVAPIFDSYRIKLGT